MIDVGKEEKLSVKQMGLLLNFERERKRNLSKTFSLKRLSYCQGLFQMLQKKQISSFSEQSASV